jgi:NAD(P)-dependent dehydrogenase (short-subunit alcohol dehydrogenase family)
MSAKVAIVVGAGGPLGRAMTVALAAGGLTVAVDRNERGLGHHPDDIRREVADATDPAVATRLIDRSAGEVGSLTCW